jgi:hypothetical protein
MRLQTNRAYFNQSKKFNFFSELAKERKSRKKTKSKQRALPKNVHKGNNGIPEGLATGIPTCYLALTLRGA